MAKSDTNESGVLVYPKLPVPTNRPSDSRLPGARKKGLSGGLVATLVALGTGAGLVGGFLVRPLVAPDERVPKLQAGLADATKLGTAEKLRADSVEGELKRVAEAKLVLENELASTKGQHQKLVDKSTEEAKRASELQDKLAAAVDKGAGTITSEGGDLRIQLVDKPLFEAGSDQLTERGRLLLGKLGTTLKASKQIWVYVHSDDVPVIAKPAPPPAPAAKKGKKPAAPPPAPAPAKTSEVELAAARSLAVIRYLHESAKVDKARLVSALALGARAKAAGGKRVELVIKK